MSEKNPYDPPKAQVADIASPNSEAAIKPWSRFVTTLASVLTIAAFATLLAGGYTWYTGSLTLIAFENAATVVALVCCGLGVTLYGPSFSHGSRLSEDGYMPTPATGNPRNRYRGVVLLCGGLCFLGLVTLVHCALS